MRTVLRLASPLALLFLAACPGGPGAACASAGECRSELGCIADGRGGSRCMAPCAEGDWLCDDGALCLESPSDGFVCWFGGFVSYARPCAATSDCEPGTTCENGLCVQACRLDAGVEGTVNPVCEDDERCLPSASARDNAGYCAPPDPEDIDAGVADGGVTSS